MFRDVQTLLARRVILLLIHQNSYEMLLFWALVRHSLMTTLVLLNMLNNGKQECEERACKGTRLAARASTTAVSSSKLCQEKLRKLRLIYSG